MTSESLCATGAVAEHGGKERWTEEEPWGETAFLPTSTLSSFRVLDSFGRDLQG